MHLDLAEQALARHLGDPLGWTPVEAANGIIRITIANVVKQLRGISAELGFDPREFALVAFGGAGPLHAVAVAQELDMQTIIVPPHPGIVCAMGLLLADMRFDNIQSHPCLLQDEAADRIPVILRQMLDEGAAKLRADGFTGELKFVAAIDMKYAVESYEIIIPIVPEEFDRATLARIFDETHKRLYGFSFSDMEYEVLSLRVTIIGPSQQAKLTSNLVAQTTQGKNKVVAQLAMHRAFDDRSKKYISTPVYARYDCPAGFKFASPAIIEEMDSTTYVPSGWQAHVDERNNLILQMVDT